MEIRDVRSQLNKIPTGKAKLRQKEPALPADKVEIGKKSGTVKLNILHVNDIHGTIEPFFDPTLSTKGTVGGLANMGTVIKDEKAKNPDGNLLLNAGDLADGSFVSDRTMGEAAGDAMGAMGFDAIGLGNHDFCWGTAALKNMVQNINAPILGANIVNGKTGKVMDGAKPYIIKDVKGVKVGIVGLDTQSTEKMISKENLGGLTFKDPVETLKKYIPEMKKKGADLLVVVTHLGFDEDKKLANEFKDESLVIVGGHTHTILSKGHREANSIIVQAGSQSRFVGNLELEWDPNSKKVIESRAELIPVIDREVKKDPDIQKIIEPYLRAIQKQGANEHISDAAEHLNYSHRKASKLNQIQADSLLEKSGAQVGLCLSSTMRRHIRKGAVSKRNLYDSFPFPKWKGTLVKANGKQIKELIESYLWEDARIAIPAGMKYEYNQELPLGNRVTELTLSDGKPIDPEGEYSVAMNDYFTSNKHMKDAEVVRNLGSLQDIYSDYFKSQCPPGGWRDNPDNRVEKVKSGKIDK